MRISNNMVVYNFLNSMDKSQNRMNSIQEQLSDGKLVHRPSDDPIRAYRGLRFNVDLAVNEQYQQNMKDAMAWMNQSDAALSDLSDLTQRAKEIVVQAVSANPSLGQEALGKQMDGLIDQAVHDGNTQIGDRYIFAGQQDKVIDGPFKRMTITVAGVPKEYVVYRGDLNKVSMSIQAGANDPRKDSVNVTGDEVFGPMTMVTDSVTGQSYATAGFFSDLLAIKNDLATGKADLVKLSNVGLANVDLAHDRLLLAQTQIGARMASYQMAQNMMQFANTTIAENASANDDVNIAKATIDFKNNENVYNASLAVGARIMPPSLVDFLK
ncbi:MAG: flagellar hook-associated protein 3 [Firmicutes bacterium]|nr:flagellar hook-associated protein 3 [Bacillota bacterium]